MLNVIVWIILFVQQIEYHGQHNDIKWYDYKSGVLQNTVRPLASWLAAFFANKTKLSFISYSSATASMETHFVVTEDTMQESCCDVMGYFRWFSLQSVVLCPKLVFDVSTSFPVPRSDTCALNLVFPQWHLLSPK